MQPGRICTYETKVIYLLVADRQTFSFSFNSSHGLGTHLGGFVVVFFFCFFFTCLPVRCISLFFSLTFTFFLAFLIRYYTWRHFNFDVGDMKLIYVFIFLANCYSKLLLFQRGKRSLQESNLLHSYSVQMFSVLKQREHTNLIVSF